MAILSRFYIVPFLAVVVYRFRTSSFFFWPLQHWRPSQIKFSSFLQWKVVFNFNISLRIDIHRFVFRYSIGFFGWLLAAAVVFRDSIRFLGCFSQLVILRCLMRGQSICLGPCWWLIVVMPPRVVWPLPAAGMPGRHWRNEGLLRADGVGWERERVGRGGIRNFLTRRVKRWMIK